MDPRLQPHRVRASLVQLRALYRHADAAYAPFSCPASGECCQLSTTRREPLQYRSPDGSVFIPAPESYPRLTQPRGGWGAGTIDLTRTYALAPARVGEPFYVSDEFGQKTWRFGAAPEQANAVKLACNLTLACAIEAMGEGSALAGAHGIRAADFIELITSTLFAGSPVYKGYGSMIAAERYSPAGFKLSLGQKDVRLAVEAGRDKGLPLAFGDALQTVLKEAVDQGDADLDLAALGKNATRRGKVV